MEGERSEWWGDSDLALVIYGCYFGVLWGVSGPDDLSKLTSHVVWDLFRVENQFGEERVNPSGEGAWYTRFGFGVGL